jgi:hypothetical protein
VFEPIEHHQIDYDALIAKLATSTKLSPQVSFDGKALSVRRGNLTCKDLEWFFGRFGYSIDWNLIGKDSVLQKHFSTKNQTQTAKELMDFIDRMVKTRNRLAHSQGAVPVRESDVRTALVVADRFSEILGRELCRFASK